MDAAERALGRPVMRVILVVALLTSSGAAQAPLFGVLHDPVPLDAFPPQAIGDLDGDGDADLVSHDALLVNDGHGRFTTVANTLAFSHARVILADVNNDGRLDALSIDSATSPNVVRIDLNAGGLLFAGPVTGLPVIPESAKNMVTGDVDGDGDLDILIATVLAPLPWSGPGRAYLWLNDGTGAFSQAPTTAFPANIHPLYTPLILQDLDGDGDLDALMHTVLLLNGGTGIFTLSPAPFWSGPTPSAVEVGRFDGDAIPDVALAAWVGGIPSIAIMIGSTAGFLPPVITPGIQTLALAAIDLNGDGIDEILTVDSPYGGISSHSVGPTGSVGPAIQSWPDLQLVIPSGRDLVVDLDGDSDRDVIAVGHVDVVELMNAGNGTMVRLGGQIAGVSLSDSQVVGDVDGDGDADIAGFVTFSGPFGTLLNDGDGLFAPGPTSTPFPPFPGASSYALHLFDRDGDGDRDLYAAVTLAVGGALDVIYDSNGGSFTLFGVFPGVDHNSAFVAADVDGDGDEDVFLGRRIPTLVGSGAAGPMMLLINLGTTGFQPVTLGGSHATFDLDVGDFDGNGWPDVFQTNKNPLAGTVGGPDDCVLYLNTGGGVYTAAPQPGLSGYFTAAGDLDGDGLTDLVIDGQVQWSSGLGYFIPGPVLPSALVGPPVLADVDGDGDLDLVEGPGTVMRNLGGGVFGPPESYLPRATLTPIAIDPPETTVVDLDRDGDLDLVAPGPLVLVNLTRQIARGSIPRPGRPASIDLYGTPGAPWFLFASDATTAFAYPPFGNVLIDPALTVLFASGTFGPSGPSAGSSEVVALTPNIPAIVGWTTHWQALDAATLTLTNRVTVTVLSF